jgi:hypothetical protein
MDHFSIALFLVVDGLVFFIGFGVGSTLFTWALRRREARVSQKVRALEHLRRNEHIDASPIAAYLVDQQRRERAARRSRRWSR